MGRLTRAGLAALCLWLPACHTPARGGSTLGARGPGAPSAPSPGVERAIEIWRASRGHAAPSEPAARAARAARRAPAPATLTADEAVAMARERSALLADLEARAYLAAAEAEAEDRYENPELRISQLRMDQVRNGEPQVRTAIRVRPSRPGEVGASVAEARAAEAVARAEARVEALSLEADVRWLFDDVLLLDAEIAAAEGVAASRGALADRMQARLEAAEATALDEASAALAAAAAEEDRVELRERRKVALATLLDHAGIDPAAPVKLVGEPPSAWPPAELPSEDVLVEAALRNRPEIEIAAARIDGADARGEAERAKRWPWFTFVELGYELAPGIDQGLGWTFQTGIELPIFDTNRGGVAAADAARAEAKRALTAEVERVAREVRGRLREARAAAALVTEMRSRALPAAERAASAARRALEGRDVDSIRALTVDERRQVLDLKLLRLIRVYREAVSELRRAVGGPIPAVTSGAPAPEGPAGGSRRSAPGE
ncbi:MAG: TolC family protein [Polyangiaceae bacterium]|nr:TolC family protein [Polyangiaceae bacterium]